MIVRSSRDVTKQATQASLEEDERVHAVLDEADKCRFHHGKGCESLEEWEYRSERSSRPSKWNKVCRLEDAVCF